MSLAFPILLVRILHRNLFVHQVLAIHVGDGRVRGFEIGKRHKSVSLGQIVVITSNLIMMIKDTLLTVSTLLVLGKNSL